MRLLRTLPSPRRTRVRRSDRVPFLELVEPRLLPANMVFTVNSAADDPSGPTPGIVTLRDAINQVNNDPTDVASNPDVIKFAISGTPTISLAADLPALTVPVIIDGTSQPGYNPNNPTPMIELSGQNIKGTTAFGLEISGGDSTIEGLIVNRFPSSQIVLDTNGGDIVRGNDLGTDATGTVALGDPINGAADLQNGLAVISSANTIGGTTPAARNVISGNGFNGIRIYSSASGNIVEGNYIGTDATGTKAVGNLFNGVSILDSTNNTIGGTAAGAGNVISGNQTNGIILRNTDTTGNLIEGNLIGTDETGTMSVGNVGQGIGIADASGNTIGGTSKSAQNIISGNDGSGVYITTTVQGGATNNVVEGNFIGTDISGTKALANAFNGVEIVDASNNTVGGMTAAARNILSGNRSDGVRISTSQGTATGNVVEGNFIGTDATGANPLPNDVSGVAIVDASGNTIGGTTAAARNIISGNLSDGVFIGTDRSGATATGNLVQGNYIGSDVTGTIPLGNSLAGVEIADSASNNTIGGTTAGDRNVISGNAQGGVFIHGSATGNLVQGNYIGSDVTGSKPLRNTFGGVEIADSASNNTIGGTNDLNLDGTISIRRGNLISGNAQGGVFIHGSATGNLVQGNYIGIDVTGSSRLDNLLDGVEIADSASNNTIGGTAAGDRNVISNNDGSGVDIRASGNLVQGNFIGTDATGQRSGLGNLLDGVSIYSGSNNTIGGTDPGARNLISDNNREGILIEPNPTPNASGWMGNLVVGNYIGTDVTGDQSLGNHADGIDIFDASDNTIGGTTDAARNLISGNRAYGIIISGGNATGNLVQGNFIGTANNGGGFVSNNQGGIEISDAANNNVVGEAFDQHGNMIGARNIISGNGGDGVLITGQMSNNNLVGGNYIGIDVTGSIFNFNTGSGVVISLGAQSNQIGVADPITGNVVGNVISGNFASGITLEDADNNIVQGNFIGTDSTGTKSLGNFQNGITFLLYASQNTIGGTNDLNPDGTIRIRRGNVIADNFGNGVDLGTTSTGNLVQGNYIGTDPSGALSLPNALNGVLIGSGAFSNTIGGSVGAARNVISGNAINGVDIEGDSNAVEGNYIGTDYSGSSRLPNGSNGVLIGSGVFSNTIGGSVGAARNVISGNASNGVDIEGYDNYVEGNYVGTDSTGEKTIYSANNYSLGNKVGVLIESSNNVVGVFTPTNGSVQGLGNVISGNSEAGVEITNQGAGNEVEGNYVGTNAEGTSVRNPLTNIGLGNDIGVLINGGAMNNTIGGTTSAAVNVISGNFTSGIDISGFAFFGEVPTSSNLVAGNDIGTDKTGTKDMGNGVGVMIEAGARNNTLGGTVRGAPNVITHNSHDGVDVLGTDTSANQILGNYIGLSASGTVSSSRGNGGDGVLVEADSTTIQGNIISANLVNGVHLSGAGATGNTIADNTIGLDASGKPAGNGQQVGSVFLGDGVLVDKGATGNTIGGSTETDYNIIAGNLGAGVHITDSVTTKNCVRGNFIGTDSSGKKSIGNGTGVLINDSTENTIGGTINGSTHPANVIGGNGVGIEISGFNSSLMGSNFIEGNCIGVTEAENGSPIGNVYGIWINDVPKTMVGGPAQDERNTISDNTSAGVYISGPDATGNLVEGNSILGRNNKRTKTSPTNPLPIGVFIQNSKSNTIGGAGAGNTIYGNNVGVYIVGTGGTSTGNQVLGNFIGLSANGASRPGNVLYGVILVNAPNNNVPQSGPSANKIVGSGIANFREFSGPVATTQPSSSGRGSGSSAKKPALHSNHVAHPSPGRTALHAQVTVHGRSVPAGPLRKLRARVRH